MIAAASRREVVAIGAQPIIAGFALAGVRLCPAETAVEVRAAWRAVAEQGPVVILTAAAAEALGAERTASQGPLTVVMPG